MTQSTMSYSRMNGVVCINHFALTQLLLVTRAGEGRGGGKGVKGVVSSIGHTACRCRDSGLKRSAERLRLHCTMGNLKGPCRNSI